MNYKLPVAALTAFVFCIFLSSCVFSREEWEENKRKIELSKIEYKQAFENYIACVSEFSRRYSVTNDQADDVVSASLTASMKNGESLYAAIEKYWKISGESSNIKVDTEIVFDYCVSIARTHAKFIVIDQRTKNVYKDKLSPIAPDPREVLKKPNRKDVYY